MTVNTEKDYSPFRFINVFTDLPINIHIGNERNVKHVVSSQLADYGITTLDQLFQAYDGGMFDDLRKSGHKTIKGIVEILKNVYLGEPLIVDAIVDDKTAPLATLFRFGFTEDELFELVTVTGKNADNSIRMIFNDYLDRTSNTPQNELRKNLIFKISTILSSCQNDSELQEPDKVVIEQLKRQIEILEDRKHGLDIKIFQLKAALVEVEEKGKGKK